MAYELDQNYCCSLVDQLADFYLRKQFCDVVLCCGFESIDCHKLVLVASSPYFKDLFLTRQDDGNFIDVSPIEPATVRLVVSFIYTGICELTHSNVKLILAASETFHITKLSEKCIGFIKDNLSPTNAMDYYQLAAIHLLDDLIRCTAEYIGKEYTHVYQPEHFNRLTAKDLKTILQYSKQFIEEDILLASILTWLQDNVKQQELNDDLFDIVSFKKVSIEYLFRVQEHPQMQHRHLADAVRVAIRHNYDIRANNDDENTEEIIERNQSEKVIELHKVTEKPAKDVEEGGTKDPGKLKSSKVKSKDVGAKQTMKTTVPVVSENAGTNTTIQSSRVDTSPTEMPPKTSSIRIREVVIGINDKDNICIFNKITSKWEDVLKLPEWVDRSFTSMCCHKGLIYMAGCINSITGGSASIVDPIGRTEVQMRKLPVAVYSPGVVCMDKRLYVIGGRQIGGASSQLGQVFRTHLNDQHEWKKLDNLIHVVHSPVVVSSSSVIYVCGGYDSRATSKCTKHLQIYNKRLELWSTRRDLPNECNAHQCCGVYMNGSLTIITPVCAMTYNDKTDTWRVASYSSKGRSTMCTKYNGTLLVACTPKQSSTCVCTFYNYNVVTNEWRCDDTGLLWTKYQNIFSIKF